MADEEPGKITASNRAGGAESARETALAGYLEWLEGRPLAARSRRRMAIRCVGSWRGWGIARRSTATLLSMRRRGIARRGITSGI